VQIATRSDARIVDPLAREADLRPIEDLVADQAVEIVLHSGGQDLEILYRRTRRLPRNVFDTQIAAALLGMGEQLAYGALVESVLGVKLEKLETLTDWTRRPLSPGQIEYALDDVRYLLPLRDELRRRLEAKGRLTWLAEETAFYEQIETYEPNTREAWRRITRTRSLEGRGLAILRELAEWREDTAREQDEPRFRLSPDDVLVEIARRAPHRVQDLALIRGLHPNVLGRYGNEIVAAVVRGEAVPEKDWPEMQTGRYEDPEGSVTLDLLEVFLRRRALEAEIAPSYLGNRRDLIELVKYFRSGATGEPKPALLTGWRHDLAGADLESAIAGRTMLHIDPESGRVVVSPIS
jgi:ribonuclease D